MNRRDVVLLTPPLLAIFAMALYVRMYRVFLWGWWIDEFDPYIRYYLTRYTLEHGLGWWWSGNHFSQFWYPHGVDWGKVLIPGTSLYGLFVYVVLSPFGVDLWRAVIAAPAVVNALAIFSMFYLGYRVGEWLGVANGGLRVGLLAALLTALSPAFVERGTAAWFDDEPISLFMIPLGLALLLEGLKRPWAGALAGAALGYVAWTWGAHFYVWNLAGLYAMVLPTYYYLKLALAPTRVGKKVKRIEEQTLPFSSRNLFLSYLLFYVVYAIFTIAMPRYGLSTLLSAFNIIPTFGLATVAAVWTMEAKLGVTKSIQLLRKYVWYAVGLAAVGIAVFAVALATGAIGGKFLATLFPFGRSAIVASVAEHATTTFGQIVSRYGPMLPFMFVSIPNLFTPSGMLVLTYLTSAGYAAATMVRLLVLLAPAALVAAAVGIVKLMENKRLGSVAVAMALISITLVATSILPALDARSPNYAVGLARQPMQIVTSAVGLASDDFLDALMWLKTRLPPYEPVASWWDYGYWISVLGNKTSLADNSTINATQIGKIGLAMMSPPQVGASIFSKEFGAKYVLAIMPYYTTPIADGTYVLIYDNPYTIAGGDFLKSYWMTQIALENVPRAGEILGAAGVRPEDFFYTRVMSYPGSPQPKYAYFAIYSGDFALPFPVPLDLNRTLYVMMFSKMRFLPMYGSAADMPWIFEGIYQGDTFTSFREMRLVGGNVYLPIDTLPKLHGAESYVIKGWTGGGIEFVSDPLTGGTNQTRLVTIYSDLLRIVYVSKPYGWVVVYQIR